MLLLQAFAAVIGALAELPFWCNSLGVLETVIGMVKVWARSLDFGEVAVRVSLDRLLGVCTLLRGLFELVGGGGHVCCE